MKTFKDATGRSWEININVAAIKRVRGLLEVDLLQAADGNLLERLSADPIFLCDVIYALCQPEAAAQKISDEDFGRGMAGEALEAATTAFMEELVNFFPPPKRRILAAALAKGRELETKVLARAAAHLNSPAAEAELEKMLQDITSSSMNSPALLDSTPTS